MTKEKIFLDEKFLSDYEASGYERPNTTVDVVIFTILNEQLHVLAIKRANDPYRGWWSLVGGYVDIQLDKDIEATAKRKLEEKTGVRTPYLEQCETFGDGERDPRGWSITTVYFALIPYEDIHLKAGKGADAIKWLLVEGGKVKENLAFDHVKILAKCSERLRSKVLYTSLPIHLLPKEFTLGELQKIYEILLQKKIDHKSFRRRILGAHMLEETGTMRYESKKPAKLYQPKEPRKIHYFMRNIEGATGEV